jgi:nicotinate-nucleotide adenylyltransferase
MTAGSSDLTRPLAIMGGAFDPVHFGHLRSAVELQEYLQLGELRFVPSANPQHRPPHFASAEIRLSMLQAAVGDMPDCTIDDREINRQGPSWSVVTLEELRAEIGSRSLCMIIGMDAFLGLPDWHRWGDLCGLAHIVVASRPGSMLPAGGPLGELLAARGTRDPLELQQLSAGKILVHEVTQLEISSSAVRDCLMGGGSARYLVPDSVLQIIEDSGCYDAGNDSNDNDSKKEQGLHA